MSEGNNFTSDKAYLKIAENIYRKIFCHFKEQYLVVFLCGGAHRKNVPYRRDIVREMLENEKISSRKKAIKIFYPEDLLIDVLNKNKSADLLSYEQFLADNSHVIVIICESPGSLVELGAFTNNNYTVDKVIAAIDKKRSKDKSFIMLGPIKYLKKRGKHNVVEYEKNNEEFVKRLSIVIREKSKSKCDMDEMMNLTAIVGMHYYIQLLLFFFKTLSSTVMAAIIKNVMREEGLFDKDSFDVLFQAALKLLFVDRKIVREAKDKTSSYRLTHIGYNSMKKMLRDCVKSDTCDKIRVSIMYNEFYKSPHS